jgi:hypothetical protein
MHQGPRVVTWRGEQFRFERLEFIGTMSVAEGETTEEFEARCVRWLAALLGVSLWSRAWWKPTQPRAHGWHGSIGTRFGMRPPASG